MSESNLFFGKSSRRQFLRQLGSLGAAATAAGLLAGCAVPVPAAAPAGEAGAAAGNQERVQIELQYQDWIQGSAELYGEIKAEAEAANPNIEVILAYVPWAECKTVTLAKMAAGNAPDIIHNSSNIMGADLWTLEPFIDHRPYLEGQIENWVDHAFVEVTLEDNSIIGVPTKVQVDPGLYLNLTVFDAAGVTPPVDATEQPWSWDEALEAAKAITNPADDTWGWVERAALPVVFGKAFPVYFWVNGTDWMRQVDQDGNQVWRSSFDLPEAQEAYRMYVGLATEHGVAPPDMVGYGYAEALAGFGGNKLGMLQMGMFFAGGFTDYPDLAYGETFDINLLPVPAGKTPVAPTAYHYFSISKQSEDPDAAWAVLSHYLAPDNMQAVAKVEFDVFPPLKVWFEAEEYNDPWKRRWKEYMVQFGRPYTRHESYLALMDSVLGPTTHEVILGSLSVDDALQALDQRINGALGFRG
jgi:multiple sugar transport system substrate-binding protein